MSKLIIRGNIAVFEFEPSNDPLTFKLEKDGTLWVEGYMTKIFPFAPAVRSMKRFTIPQLMGFELLGHYNKIKKSYRLLVLNMGTDVNLDNCIVFNRISGFFHNVEKEGSNE